MNTSGKKFPAYRRPCGWNALLPARTPAAALTRDTECDVAVVGAGYTGIAAARRWAELAPGDDVLLLDASTIGEGNPGRNSGFLLEIALAQDADTKNLARMRECNALLQETMAGIVADVAASGIDCGLERCGTYRAAAGSEGIVALDHYRRFLEAAALPFDDLDSDALAERIGSAFYRRGLFSPHCYLAQPAALARALAARLPPSVRLHEASPVVSIDAERGGWRLRTPRAGITARRVVVANNAFSKGLGVAGSRIVAMYTYGALTGRLDASQLAHCGRDPQWGLLPAHRLGSTLRRTRDGRLLIRSYYGYEQEADNATIEKRLCAALERRYPALAGAAFDAVWGGATGFTYNASPVWGEPARGLYVSVGCNGGGVVKGTLFGRLLAGLAHGAEVPDVPALFGRASWMPPEPLRRLGFALIAGLERRRAQAEV